MSATTVVAAIFAYFYFVIHDPDRIQSEDWQLENQRILQGSKEEPFITVTAQTVSERRLQIAPSEGLLPDVEPPDGNAPDDEPENTGG